MAFTQPHFMCCAVPLTVFTVDYCIRYPACSMKDVAAMELETVTISETRNSSYDEDTGRGPVYTTAAQKPGSSPTPWL